MYRFDNNKIMVENYGESVQDRIIPNPIRTFGEAYADYREFPFFLFLGWPDYFVKQL